MKRILICEDEDTIREFVVINLKRAGYDVVDVNCGEAALKTFETERGNFDVVHRFQQRPETGPGQRGAQRSSSGSRLANI